MDTSETYIKMCEKAEKIQEHYYIPDDCLLAQWGKKCDDAYISIYTVLGNEPDRYSTPIWLPRQDQLQEMVGLWINNRFEVMKILKKFYDFSIKDLTSDLTWSLFSMEQLWLAFAMNEKYNKTWDGEQWIIKEIEFARDVG